MEHMIFALQQNINFTRKYVNIEAKTGTVCILNIYLLYTSVKLVIFTNIIDFLDGFIHRNGSDACHFPEIVIRNKR